MENGKEKKKNKQKKRYNITLINGQCEFRELTLRKFELNELWVFSLSLFNFVEYPKALILKLTTGVPVPLFCILFRKVSFKLENYQFVDVSMNEQQADDIFHRLTKCVLTMERIKSSSLNDRSEFCPFTSEIGNWPQIFSPLRKEKKENLINLYTRIPFSIFYSSRPCSPILTNILNIIFVTTKIFMSQFYDNIASSHRREKWKIFRHLFLSYIISTYYLSTWRGEKREELHHENVTLHLELPLDEVISRPSENVQRMQWSSLKTIETAGVESDARVSFPL